MRRIRPDYSTDRKFQRNSAIMFIISRCLHFLVLTTLVRNGIPCQMLTVEDYENYAKERLPLGPLQYLQRGADKDLTLNRNYEALSKIRVIPRYLVDVSNRSTHAEALGKSFKLPIGIAPSGLHKRWHVDGELATVRAAQTAGTIMIVSSGSSVLFEDIVKEAPAVEKWMQMFLYDNKTVTNDFVQKAEELGFGALVITVDQAVPTLRYFNKKNNYKDQHERVNFEKYKQEDASIFRRVAATWRSLEDIANSTRIPIIVKGILTAEDAKLAYLHGAKGVIVSNHGGRVIDGTISSIEALSDIITNFPEASDHGFEIYFDSGVRSGLDVFRALAIGAKFVFVGRAAMWGLFHSGQQGVENVFRILKNELDTLLAQTGCNSINDINSKHVSYQFPF